MRKPREHGWRTFNGITHHIDTRRPDAYRTYARTATCGAALRRAKRVRFDSVDCMTCIVRVAQRTRLPPRRTPTAATPSWWTVDDSRHVLSDDDPWRAACGVSLRMAAASGNPPNCVPCGGRPDGLDKTRSLRSPDGVRHATRLDYPIERYAPCGADLFGTTGVRKAPNCAGCRAALSQKERNHGRQVPRTQRR